MTNLLPGSSVVERAPVKRVVTGSSPVRAAIPKPVIPVEYEQACTALSKCLNIDDAKMWDAKADALAAWAKIYHDNDAGRKAKALKLHAYRRMGILSRKVVRDRPKFDSSGPVPGARALLISHGLKMADADSALRAARAPSRVFNKAVNAERPPAPSSFLRKERDTDMTDMARAVKRAFVEATPFCRKVTVVSCARELSKADKGKLVETLTPVYEWLDEFMQRCKP